MTRSSKECVYSLSLVLPFHHRPTNLYAVICECLFLYVRVFHFFQHAWHTISKKNSTPVMCYHQNPSAVEGKSLSTVPAFNSCTKCVGRQGIIHKRSTNCHRISWECMQGWPHNWMYSYDLQAMWVVDVQMAYFCDILSMGVCTTRHWKTSGRLVQELNVCTVQHVECTFDNHSHCSKLDLIILNGPHANITIRY